MSKLKVIPTTGYYSRDMRNKPISIKSYYQLITTINKQSIEAFNVANLGFYQVGQLLLGAKKELIDDFGKLKKELAEDGLHEKAQERYMKIARDPNIQLNYTKLPPQWTLWERLADLKEGEFELIEDMLHTKVTWNDLLPHIPRLNKKGTTTTSSTTSLGGNSKDNRYELFGLELNAVESSKSSADEFNQLTKDIRKLVEKYDIIELKEKNFYVEADKFLNNAETPDDTSSKDKKKFDKQYSTSKKKGF